MIRYFCEDIKFEFKNKLLNNRWLKFVASSEVRKLQNINIIFCSDNYILDVNMKYLQHDFSDELNRVIVHGILHLIGYDDHTDEEQKIMRSKEDYYLSLRPVVCGIAK